LGPRPSGAPPPRRCGPVRLLLRPRALCRIGLLRVHFPMTLDHHYQPVRTELEQVRADMSRYWHDAIDMIAEPSERLPRLGGKLLRPALCLLAAGAAGAHDLRPFVPLAGAL